MTNVKAVAEQVAAAEPQTNRQLTMHNYDKIIFFIAMKRFCFYILFLCSGISTFAQHAEWREFIDKKQFEKVILQAENLQPADSADFSKMFLIGQAYEGLLKYRDAYNCYIQCYTLDSTRTDMLNTLARISGYIGRAKEAEKYYKQVVGYDSTNFYANYQLARLYVQQGKHSEGMKYYDFLLERDTANISLIRAKGDCYILMDSLPQAAALYGSAFYSNVEDASLAVTYSNTLLKLGGPVDAEEALVVCDLALAFNPEDLALRQKKAMIHFLFREFQTADSIYTILLEEKDSSYLTLKYGGCSKYYTRKWIDAIEPLEKAFEKDTTAADVCLLLGMSLGRTYDPVLAFQYFDKAEKIMAPDEYWSKMLIEFRAETYVKVGDCKKCAPLYYQLWNKEKTRLSLIQNILSCYDRKRFVDMNDEEKQRYLFLCFLYTSEVTEAKENTEQEMRLSYTRSRLELYQEEMFFKGMKNYPMLSPDNKKNTISIEKIKEIIGKLPERKVDPQLKNTSISADSLQKAGILNMDSLQKLGIFKYDSIQNIYILNYDSLQKRNR